MDPNATLQILVAALTAAAESRSEPAFMCAHMMDARDAMGDLIAWVCLGGFEPEGLREVRATYDTLMTEVSP